MIKCLCLVLVLVEVTCSRAIAPGEALHGLQVTYGSKGIERVTFGRQTLSDVERWPEDQFHIWHMKCFDRTGRELTTGEYGWGENNQGRTWDVAEKTWTYRFAWGTLRVQFKQRGDALDVITTATNRGDSGVAFDGASVYPLTFHLPASPKSPGSIVDGAEAPGVSVMNWGDGQVIAVAPDADKPVWSGFQPGAGGAFVSLVSGTRPDALKAEAGERPGLAVQPGQSVVMKLSFRFARGSSLPIRLANDAYRAFALRWPPRLEWKDRSVIGTVYMASSGHGNKTQPAGFRTNPRRYFNDNSIDVKSAQGLAQFQARVLAQAETVVQNMRRMDAQGAITWDIEGQEYPQDTSYVCAPDAIAQVAPEMESVIRDSGSRYVGMKLDDAYFRTIRDAGFRVGVCVRPQSFVVNAGTASQVSLPDGDVAAELIRKMRYAHDRWGVTLFYMDSTVRADGSSLPAEVLEKAAAAVPDSLVMPEESTTRMYRVMAPFQTFMFHGDLGTQADVRGIYPHAFSVNLVNDVEPAKLFAHHAALMDSVRRGDVLLLHADTWHTNNAVVVEMLRQVRPGKTGN
jgi:hypothetical protein